MKKKPKSHNAEETDYEVRLFSGGCPFCGAPREESLETIWRRGYLTCPRCGTTWGIDFICAGAPP